MFSLGALLLSAGVATTPVDTPPLRKPRVAPPEVAFRAGLMPLASTGMTSWRLAHPGYDGRGVLIAILDGGVDPAVPGLLTTTTGEPKILDLRDFSGENDVALAPIAPDAQGCAGGVCGLAAILAAADAGTQLWRGSVRELPLGRPPFADLNGNGTNRDSFAVVVARTGGRWQAWVDANGEGTMANVRPLSDFAVRRESFTFGTPASRGQGLVTAAINLREEGGQPRLAVVFGGDHATHVAGIAAGHTIFGQPGLDGVAPGAQLITLKVSNNARGGVSTTGSMLRAMQYAVQFAHERSMPLVMNMSFGVGNANEGRAVMDSIVNAFLIEHPDVFFAIAAGNDGPGTSTLGEPGSAELCVSVGASYPAAFAQFQFDSPTEALGWWSSRGGEIAKPDLVAPGLAYSTVPAWDQGGEVKGGTSMATPYVSGMAAVLLSAMAQEGRATSPAQILAALRAGSKPFPGESYIDEGPGLVQIEPAWAYLKAGHEAVRYRVEAMSPAPPRPAGLAAGAGLSRGGVARADVAAAQRGHPVPGAYRRDGLASGDTIQRFRISLVPDPGVSRRARNYTLSSDAEWLRSAARSVTIDSLTGSAVVELRYSRAALMRPGRYVGAVTAVAADDAGAAPAFVLLNTVVVADTAAVVRAGRAAPGSASRYFVRVPAGAGGLLVAFTSPDSAAQASLSLFEPTGRPGRGDHTGDLGDSSRTITLDVAAEDIEPGAYEVVVQAMPGKSLPFDLTARPVSAHAIVDSGGSPAVRLELGADSVKGASLALIGSAWSLATEIRESGPWAHVVPVPPWAKSMIVEVAVSAEVWDQVTDFSITVFDTTGAQLGNGDMNYPYHRITAELPQDRTADYRAVVELSPGFANPVAPPSTPVHVRIRFEGEPRSLWSEAGALRGRTLIRVPSFAPLAAGEGFEPLLLLRAGALIERFTLPR